MILFLAILLGIIQDLLGRALLDDDAALEVDDAIGRLSREGHLV